MSTRLPLAMLALLLGCDRATPTTTVVTGAVAPSAGFSHPSAIYNREKQVEVLISDDPAQCDHLITVGNGRSEVILPDGGLLPSLFIELGTGHFLGNERRTVHDDLLANFTAGAAVQFENGGLCAAVASDDGGTRCIQPPAIDATAGTAELERADDPGDEHATAEGTFTLQFGHAGAFAGSFHAEPCSALHSSCQSAGGGLALLPLGLLLLALCGRNQKRPV